MVTALDYTKPVPGDRLLVWPGSWAPQPPRRWQMVALRSPLGLNAGIPQWLVKRVVGLPGETLAIDRGDVYINGRIARKTLNEQRALAVLVDDARYPRPRGGWSPDGEHGGWRYRGGGFELAAPPASPAAWLAYHPDSASGGSGLTNRLGYNQAGVGRGEESYIVSDWMLSVRTGLLQGRGRLLIAANAECGRFLLLFDTATGQAEAWLNCAMLRRWPWPSRQPQAIDVSLFDRQFLVACDGVVRATYHLPTSGNRPAPSGPPFAVGGQSLALRLESLRLYRDVYYTPAGPGPHSKRPPEWTLARDEYFVLGDNSALSVDSRVWTTGSVVRSQDFIGTPFIAISGDPSWAMPEPGFQVPGVGGFRYIRP